MLKVWQEALLDIVYPPKCPVCHARVEVHGAWCRVCLAGVWQPREINLAMHRLTALAGCLAVADYSDGVKRLLYAIKYWQMPCYAVYLTWLLRQADISRFGRPDLVVPVPLHHDRLARRGYNQTSLIFRPWAVDKGLQWREDVLLRHQPTLPQWELPLSERRRNIKGAFQVTRRDLVEGKCILLVDDIITTGATLAECSTTLKRAGAAAVYGLALASGAR